MRYPLQVSGTELVYNIGPSLHRSILISVTVLVTVTVAALVRLRVTNGDGRLVYAATSNGAIVASATGFRLSFGSTVDSYNNTTANTAGQVAWPQEFELEEDDVVTVDLITGTGTLISGLMTLKETFIV